MAWYQPRLGFRITEEQFKVRALLLMPSTRVSFNRNYKVLLRSLRVLDFSKIKMDTIEVVDLLNWIFSLKRLAYLNLNGVSDINELPYSIQKLPNLQFLVLRNCNSLAKLHPSITNLKKLIVLDQRSRKLQYLPNGLEKLVHLQELSGFRGVSQANTKDFRLHELLKLQQLRIPRMYINNSSEISKGECNVFSELRELKVLAIDAENCKEKRVSEMLDQLSPPPLLKELYLRRYRRETLPKWINLEKLSKLQYLCLEDGDVNHLPMSLNDESGDKWKVEGLRLEYMQNLVLHWNNLEMDMPLLLHAEVSHCYRLTNFPIP